MIFTPDLDLKVVTRCTKFSIQDKTGVDTGNGDKWSGIAGLDPATLTYAVIRVITPSGSYTDHNILPSIPSPVTGSWWFNDITGSGDDGLHQLVYRLKTTSFNITAFASYGTTVFGTVLVTANVHGLETGMFVDITGSNNYDGEYYVTKLSANQFYITAPWVANDGACVGKRMYSSIFYPYVYCKVEAGVERMAANISRLINGPIRDAYINDAITANGLLIALKSAVSSSNIASYNAIHLEINHILSFNDVDTNL